MILNTVSEIEAEGAITAARKLARRAERAHARKQAPAFDQADVEALRVLLSRLAGSGGNGLGAAALHALKLFNDDLTKATTARAALRSERVVWLRGKCWPDRTANFAAEKIIEIAKYIDPAEVYPLEPERSVAAIVTMHGGKAPSKRTLLSDLGA